MSEVTTKIYRGSEINALCTEIAEMRTDAQARYEQELREYNRKRRGRKEAEIETAGPMSLFSRSGSASTARTARYSAPRNQASTCGDESVDGGLATTTRHVVMLACWLTAGSTTARYLTLGWTSTSARWKRVSGMISCLTLSRLPPTARLSTASIA